MIKLHSSTFTVRNPTDPFRFKPSEDTDGRRFLGASMIELIQGNRPKELQTVLDQIVKVFQDSFFKDFSGLLYLGYPLIKTPEGTRTIRALLASEELGVYAFDVVSPVEDPNADELSERQDLMYNQLESKLRTYREITDGRKLAFEFEVITFFPTAKNKGDYKKVPCIFFDSNELVTLFKKKNRKSIVAEMFGRLKGVLQGVSKLKHSKDRPEAQTVNSKGAIAKQLEAQIAHLDIYQNKAIVEMTDSPQRITGLAGTGKTVVIAGKAAYLHAVYPELTIAITFYSRSLYQQYRHLLTRLYFNQTGEEPDWTKIKLLHAWGGSSSGPGFYTSICEANGLPAVNYAVAKNKYGIKKSFTGVCDELRKQLQQPKEIFDYVLIDEAQDMPQSFFELAYLCTSSPHRVVWAYDELQQLTEESSLPEPEILFGKSADNSPRFSFTQKEEDPNDDIILKVCYRNPKEIITTAHALGLGVYSSVGPIQMIEDEGVWNRIGYRVEGTIQKGQSVKLVREADASPSFLEKYLAGTDLVSSFVAKDFADQDDWVVNQILKNLSEDELQPSDILLIALGPVYNLAERTMLIREKLRKKDITTHVAGAASADEYFRDGSVAISQIFRAKGNEAAMVYIIDAHTCASGSELIIKRNTLFTAITRSRGWVRICGVGDNMKELESEISSVKNNQYQLNFQVPSDIAQRRKLHGELSAAQKRKRSKEINKLQEVLSSLSKGDIEIADIPVDILKKLEQVLKNES